MIRELAGVAKRQYSNLRTFKAYSLGTLMKELFLLPRDFLSASGRSSNVLNVALFVTMRCNARCAMCNLSEILNKKDMADIPMDKIERFLDDVAGYHPSIILFGGEPFVRKDIVDIVKAVKKRGLSVGIFTNGTLLDKDTAERLMLEKLDYIVFSLLGTKDVHDTILSMNGAYDKMVKGIKAFTDNRRRNTKVVTHTTICEGNLDDLKNIASASASLGVDLVRFGHPTFYSTEERSRCNDALKKIFEEGDVKAMSYIYDIRGKEDRYVEKITKLRSELGNRVAFTPELSVDELKSWYSPDFSSGRKCLFALRGLFIYPNGDVYPCESISCRMGNVFDSGFSNVWNGERYKKFRRILKRGLLPACARCCKL
ncbi:MAG: radical SAM protein [Candidatus Omnitrophica bacterium]|nr:radical SAM protein [Candidatus Omnitrophota bacterium]